MMLFAVLSIIAIIILIIAIALLVTGGVTFIIIFGDLIVCVAIIVLLIRWLFFRDK